MCTSVGRRWRYLELRDGADRTVVREHVWARARRCKGARRKGEQQGLRAPRRAPTTIARGRRRLHFVALVPGGDDAIVADRANRSQRTLESMLSQDLINKIAEELSITPRQVAATLALFEDGNTLPFIARYRKEVTGGLDEVEPPEVRAGAE